METPPRISTTSSKEASFTGIVVVPGVTVTPVPDDAEEIRKEDYVKNILIFGIKEASFT